MLWIVRRGILGGTFDPPHLAHMVAGEAAYRELGLSVVTFLPAGVPWQKSGLEVTGADRRWEMTRRTVAGIDYFEADSREIMRSGPTYTADTLASYPDSDEIFLILGADAAAGLPTWSRPDDVLARARVVVMPRPGMESSRVESAVGPVHWLDTPLLPISGTLLRARRRSGASLRFLVHDEVLAYIESSGLYG
jgi:nicotinate-nucleotide adenylyltransferase